MKVVFDNTELTLHFNEFTHSFSLTDKEGEMYDRTDPPGHFHKVEPNMTWVDSHYLDLLVSNGIVEATEQTETDADGKVATLCRIVHDEFNDGGYSPFGDFCRSRLGQQCQYGSRYIDGCIEGYPALGKGLRFNNGKGYNGQVRELDASDYHSVRIHRDDMDEFERRYKAYVDAKVNG